MPSLLTLRKGKAHVPFSYGGGGRERRLKEPQRDALRVKSALLPTGKGTAKSPSSVKHTGRAARRKGRRERPNRQRNGENLAKLGRKARAAHRRGKRGAEAPERGEAEGAAERKEERTRGRKRASLMRTLTLCMAFRIKASS